MKKNQNHIALGAVASKAASAAQTGGIISSTVADIKNIASQLKGKPAKGLHHRKLAAAINYFRSRGYSVAQMQAEPLRSIIVYIGGLESKPIKDIVSKHFWLGSDNLPLGDLGGHFHGAILPALGLQRDESDLPIPAGNQSVYVQPPDGSALDSIVQSVFGPVPGFGTKLTESDLYQYAPSAQTSAQPLTFDQKIKAIEQTKQLEQAGPQYVTESAKGNREMLAAVRPVMESGLRAAGYVPLPDLDGLAMQFYEKIVVPATGNMSAANTIDDSVTNAILTFIGGVAAKQREGVEQNKIFETIGRLTNQIADKVEAGIEQRANTEIGAAITGNIGMILVIVAVVVILMISNKK